MNIAIIIPTPHFAGPNIKENLLALSEWEHDKTFDDYLVHRRTTPHHDVRIFTSDTFCTHLDNIDDSIRAWGFSPDALVIATTHRSEAGVQSLTVHPIGNWTDDVKFGGKARTIIPCPALLMRACLDALRANDTGAHSVTMEATHHGPFVSTPTMFIEIGSEENAWKDPALGKAVALALDSVISTPLVERPVVFGIGGPHYCPNLVALMQKEDIAVGHVCAKYGLGGLDEAMLLDAVQKSGAQSVVLDWKGLGPHKERIVAILEKNKIAYRKI